MRFRNRENKRHIIGGQIVWESRSVAVNGVVIIFLPNYPVPFVMAAERGPKAADNRGKWNLIAGYLDWDETGTEALYREAWEEVGLDLRSMAYPERDKDSIFYDVIANNLEDPWHVQTDPFASNHQNVSLRYGLILALKEAKFPDISLDNNEVEGEVGQAFWMPVNEIDKYDWAYNHDKVIKDYLARKGLSKFLFTT